MRARTLTKSMWFILVVQAAICCLLLVGFAAPEPRPGVVRASTFELVDAEGRVRAALLNDPKGPVLRLFGKDGATHIQLGATEVGSEIAIWGPDGKLQLTLQGNPKGAGVQLHGPDGPAFLLSTTAAGASMSLGTRTDDKPGRVLLSATEKGGYMGVLSETGSEVGALSEADGGGVLLVTKPDRTQRIELLAAHASLLMYDSAGAGRLALMCDRVNGPSVSLHGQKRELRASLREANGYSRLTMFSEGQDRAFDVIGGAAGATMKMWGPGNKAEERILLSTLAHNTGMTLNDADGRAVLTLPPPQVEERKEPPPVK